MMVSQDFERSEARFGWIINHLPAILWQRRIYVVTVFAAFLLISVVAAFSLPTLYRSSATLLIESQQISKDVAEAPGIGTIERRIAKIREQVLSRGDLISLIERYNLYPSKRRSEPLSEIINEMRESTSVGALSGDIGKANAVEGNIIALNLAFDYPDAAKAQEVLQSFVSSFLQMDSEGVEDQASLTVRFLQDQSQKLRTEIQLIEGQLTELKARNGAVLMTGGMAQMVDTGSYSAQIVGLENQNRQLLLESRKPADRDQRLTAAENALASAEATYADSHPDVIAARERLKRLRLVAPATSDSGEVSAVQDQIRANNTAIASLRSARDGAIGKANAALAGQSRAPAILEQASQLEDRANVLRAQYNDASTNLLKAQNSARMASEQRAERLSLVEPPNLPDQPNWPNRPLLIGAGAAAGLVFGLLLALLVELLRRPLRSPVQIEGLGLAVLGIVPEYEAPGKKRRWQLFGRGLFGRGRAELA